MMLNAHAIWALGFRPFFFAAGLAAVALIPAWLLVYTGHIPAPRYYGPPSVWHAHEMLFGFPAAVVVGFLFTASKNWTGLPGISGWRLQVLAGIWALARVLPLVPPIPAPIYAAIDLAFLPLAAAFLWPFLARKQQRRNIGLLILVTLLAVANVLVHLGTLGLAQGMARRGLLLALDTIVVIQVIIAGRVLPMFTRNALADARVRVWRLLEVGVIAAAAAYLVSDTIDELSPMTSIVAAFAAALNAVRLIGWDPWAMRRTPMLWVLAAGYAWLTVGFILKAAELIWALPPALAIHAFAVGGIGVMTYGFMPRVSLGHTGRKIDAKLPLQGGFILINLAALFRVLVAGLSPTNYTVAVVASGILWTLAFAIFVMLFARILWSPRIDGRPG